MAKTTRNSFDPTKNRKGVLFQTRPLVDADLNEAQDIGSDDAAAVMRAMLGVPTAAGAIVPISGMALGYVENPEHWRPNMDNSGKISMAAGDLFVNGYRIFAETGTDTGITLAQQVTNTYGFLYADIYLDEVDATEDATIQFPQMGETAVRRVIKIDFAVCTDSSNYESALIAPLLLPDPPAGGGVQTGYKARVFLARFFYPANTSPTAIGNNSGGKATLTSLLQRATGETELLVNSPEALLWTGQYLSCGNFDNDTNAQLVALEVILGNESFRQYIARSSGAEPALNVLHPRFASPPIANTTWDIPTGYALGWLGNGGGYGTGQLLTSPQDDTYIPDGFVWYFDTKKTATSDRMQLTQLDVRPIRDFKKQPGSRMLCYRAGNNDLVFPNSGTVLAAPRTGRTTIGRLGVNPSEWDLVVSPGAGGVSHVYGDRALARMLEAVWYNPIAADYYDTFSIFARVGTHVFSAVNGSIGPAPNWREKLHIKGEGANRTTLRASTGTHSTPTFTTIRADTIILEDLKLSEIAYLGSTTRSYGWAFVGSKVIIRNCIFDCPVKIQADVIEIENCEGTFYNQSGNRVEHANSYLGASVLHLKTSAGAIKGLNWTIRNCFFGQGSATITDKFPVVLLETVYDGAKTFNVKVEDCNFDFDYDTGAQLVSPPAISISGPAARIAIKNCGFWNHPGFAKGTAEAQQTTPLSATTPFVGSPMNIYLADYVNMTAAAYISCVTARNYASSIDVANCTFDLSHNGDAVGTSAVVLGAFMALHNGYTVRNANAFVVANIAFHHNTLNMARRPGATRNYGNFNLWTSGFYLGAIPDGLPISTNYSSTPPVSTAYAQTSVYWNIRCDDNVFDLGCEDAAGGFTATAQLWCSYEGLAPASLGMHDSSCLFGISLKNQTFGGNFNGKRGAHGVTFSRNNISFRSGHTNTGATQFYTQNELLATSRRHFFVILETDDFVGTNSMPTSGPVPTQTNEGDPGGGTTFTNRFGLQAIVSPLVSDNFFEMNRSSAQFVNTAYLIRMSRCLQPRVQGNFMTAPGNGGSVAGAYFDDCYGALFTANQVLGLGAYAARSSFAADKNRSAANNLTFADVTQTGQVFTDGTDFDETLGDYAYVHDQGIPGRCRPPPVLRAHRHAGLALRLQLAPAVARHLREDSREHPGPSRNPLRRCRSGAGWGGIAQGDVHQRSRRSFLWPRCRWRSPCPEGVARAVHRADAAAGREGREEGGSRNPH